MANEMCSLKENPFAYMLTYKFSQDHTELLFSYIRSKGGWNNNPNSMQVKYALRKMLFTNAVKASKNSNCIDFSERFSSGIIPIFHKRKHRSPLMEEEEPENDSGFTLTEQLLKLIKCTADKLRLFTYGLVYLYLYLCVVLFYMALLIFNRP